MQIIEKLCRGKSTQDACEDALFYSEDFIAVIDGVSSKTSLRINGQTTGKIASTLIKSTLSHLDPKSHVTDFIGACNSAFETYYQNNHLDINLQEVGLQAVAAVYSKSLRQIWLIGDAQARISDTIYQNNKVSDEILANFRSLISHIEMEINEETPAEYFKIDDGARLQIIPWILKSTIFANNENSSFGYAVINGKDIPLSLINIIEVPENYEGDIILASDGYPHLKNTLGESESYLSKVLEQDPYLIESYHSTKGVVPGNESYDDRTFIRFKDIRRDQ
ncbi:MULTISPECIES: hypothetical protein [Aerococcus]|uniref:Protein phosphatase 2C domain-containing protein n=1 Tax=Aerococcus sanguinicola TaxID=119206 RepID=A0A5N1GJF8_9LACT|nr:MULTISPECIES: hypothetical protein [Aerococcus]KAA9300151.1 hypothetical protein F6I03_08300 [Aerococcus sanguinicola]MDK6369493.1 hypothetical protein [Aerococcus sp. UMB9870]MDK6679980.1 hypothetical protein [Aerococcus sp. UMB8608]MDK6686138.1 hypothetical protein [Aerococcus sp. UMB8623]MDK6939918.1 hypothetical protein [Aerococcus sp. UMB8487]